MNMHIQTPRIDSKSLFMGENVHISPHLLIPNPIHGKRMEVRIIVYFVKCDQIKLEAEWILCICMLVFQKWCPGFKSPSLKWAHHKTNTVWQQAGSLCSYEAQNLMSMNNEYYSTCWWLSRLPVIRPMKALFSREHSLSRWITDSHQPRIHTAFPTRWTFSNAENQQTPMNRSQNVRWDVAVIITKRMYYFKWNFPDFHSIFYHLLFTVYLTRNTDF